jgi:PAS domain-containing protein/HAMP domain-containing protein
MSLRLKLIIVFLAVALIPLLFVSVMTFHNYKNSLETTCLSNLQNITAFKADKINAYFTELRDNIEIAQGFYNIKKNLPVLIRFAGDSNNPEAAAARKTLEEQLQQMQSVSDMTDIMLVGPEGKIVYANKPGHYLTDMSAGFDAEQNAFMEGKNRICFSEVYFDKTQDNRSEMLVTAPATDFTGNFIGVIAFEVDMTAVYKIMKDITDLGKTGEVLVGKKKDHQVVFLTPLKFAPQDVLSRKIDIGQDLGGPMQEAVQGRNGAGQLIDYRGKKVVAAWRHIPLLNWGLVAKIDTKEAFNEVTKLRHLSIVILAMVIVLSSITAFSIAHSISSPIQKLTQGAEIIGRGNLDYKIGIHLNDEIGQLSRSFDKMTYDLKHTTASRDELNREIAERKRIEDALKFLVQCGEPSSGEDFFQSLARYLGQNLNMDFVCIDRLEENLLAARTVAVYCDGKFEDNISYTLKDTPCGDVVGKTICCFPKDVCHLFPRDTVLANLAAESYLGTTLWSSQGKPIGLIALIGRKPLADTKLAESILQLAAVRAAGELERRQDEEALVVAHQRLVLAQQSAGAGIWDWDIREDKLDWSPELFHLFGLDPTKEKPSFDLWRSILHPQDGEGAQMRIEQAIGGRTPLDSEYRIFLPTGQVRWINALGSAVYDENGKPQRMSGN